jgi:hypothetical protein
MEIIEQLKKHWERQRIKIGKGESELEISNFEKKYNVLLPEDLRYYFRTLNGMDCSDNWISDDELITFWPLNEVKPFNELFSNSISLDPTSLYVIADYSINAGIYLIHLSSILNSVNPVYVLFGDIVKVSDSFQLFIERYIKGDTSVLFPC